MMARSRSSMRMGSLNLLLLVIALSLLVMGVLALVSARANDNLSARQAESTYETYMEETAGQFFVRSVDARLNVVRGSDVSPQVLYWTISDLLDQMASNAVNIASSGGGNLTYECDMLTMDDLKAEMGLSANGAAQTEEGSDEGIVEIVELPAGSDQENIEILDDDVEFGETDDPDIKTAVAITSEMADTVYGRSNYDSIHNSQIEEYDSSLSSLLGSCIGGIRAEFITPDGRSLLCVIAINEDATYEIMKWQSSKIWNTNSQSDTLWLG